jgi:hypothetical protein
VRDADSCRDAIGGEGDVVCERDDAEVVDGCRTRLAGEQHLDDLVAIEDTSGGAKFPELLGEQRDEGCAIRLAVRVEQALFERAEMILKLRVFHATHSNCYTNGGAAGFNWKLRRNGILNRSKVTSLPFGQERREGSVGGR